MGRAKLKNQTTPDTPDPGITVIYVDSADKNTKQRDDTGTIKDLTSTMSDTFASIEVDGTPVSTAAPTLDFNSSDFLLVESPTDDFDVTVKDSGIDHDATTNFVANEHIDWTAPGAGTIHTDNYIENATHTGEVTGSGVLTVDKTAISNKTLVTAAAGDHVLIGDLSDTDNLKRVTAQSIADLNSTGMFGSQFSTAESVGSSSTTSETYVEKLTHTTASLPAGDYRVGWFYQLGNTNNDRATFARVQLDNTTDLVEHNVTKKTNTTPNVAGFEMKSGWEIVTLTAATHQVDIDFKSNGEGTAQIKEARLEIWRIS